MSPLVRLNIIMVILALVGYGITFMPPVRAWLERLPPPDPGGGNRVMRACIWLSALGCLLWLLALAAEFGIEAVGR